MFQLHAVYLYTPDNEKSFFKNVPNEKNNEYGHEYLYLSLKFYKSKTIFGMIQK